jgi:hypothetical protein
VVLELDAAGTQLLDPAQEGERDLRQLVSVVGTLHGSRVRVPGPGTAEGDHAPGCRRARR